MIYVFENQNNYASVVYDESVLALEQKSRGIAIEALPSVETPEGKQAILKCRKSTGDVWWDLVNKHLELDNEVAELQEQIRLMQTALDELILNGGV